MSPHTLVSETPVTPATVLCEEAINENLLKGLPVNDEDYAIIVGVSHYASLAPLHAPITDACRLRNWLIKADGGNMHPKHVFFIPSAPGSNAPDQLAIDKALYDILQMAEARPARRLYFYFSGHGFGANWEVNGMCLPIWSPSFYNAALSSKAYLDLLVEQDRFQEIYFFLDCCRDRKINTKPLHSMLGSPQAGGANTMAVVLYASEYENPAWEGMMNANGNLQVHGYFSRALMEALNGGAVNNNGDITITSFIDYVREKTESYAHERNHTQTVRSDIRNNKHGLNHVIHRTGRIPGTVLTITFETAGDITLDGPDLNNIKAGPVQAGETWLVPLGKGYHQITNKTTRTSAFITIDGTLKTMHYAF
ncbi:caspase family protein [Chitinophaga rhizophila]|uniref:Caspase family protein n=1 Tax=Chitinophaga rhizophila TaxID=2866212 RepID=A0ABS7GKB2_9BACT|nr:caspase family protein [Chitinophaga rhizophila]MBW8688143.1 caspase family protein [Chitinophaga rhizophila]